MQHTGSVTAMEPQSPTPTSLVHARLGEFFAHRSPWHRRLWSVGTVLAIQEVIEYAEACLNGAMANTEGLKYVTATAKREVERDPGAAPLKTEIVSCLGQLDVASSSKIPLAVRDELDQLVRRLEPEYLGNWCTAATEPPVEFAARALASHLLDLGFSLITYTAGMQPSGRVLQTSTCSPKRPGRW